VDWFADDRHREILDRIRSGGAQVADVGAADGPAPLTGVVVVITGTLAGWSRDSATEAVQARGGKVTGSVSKKTTFVVVGADPGAGKYDRARALKLPLLDEAGFTVLLEAGPQAAAGHTLPGPGADHLA
jgi:DNA ligase (NAD+)